MSRRTPLLQRMRLHRPPYVFALLVCPKAEADLFKVTQKKDIKRQKERLEGLKKEAETEKAAVRQTARERVLREFEKGQLGLATGPSAIGTKAGGDVDTGMLHIPYPVDQCILTDFPSPWSKA